MNVINSFSPRLAVRNNINQNANPKQSKALTSAQDVFSKSKVSFGRIGGMSDTELANGKRELQKTLFLRHFSPKLSKEIVAETDKDNFDIVNLLANDKYCHSSTIKNIMYHVNPKNESLMKQAALYRDYDALLDIRDGNITDFSQIRYMRDKVTKEYRPNWKEVKEYSPNEMLHYKKMVMASLTRKNFSPEEIKSLTKSIDNENLKVMVILATGNCVRPDIIRFAAENINVENSELFLRACTYDDYEAIFSIVYGKIRTNEEVDARAERKYQNGDHQSFRTESQSHPKTNNRITKEQFIEIACTKLSNVNFQLYQLKDSEIRNLAKLLGTTTDQITNMNKQEFRRLIKKFHPDTNKTDPYAKTCYEFVKTLYDKSPQKGK